MRTYSFGTSAPIPSCPRPPAEFLPRQREAHRITTLPIEEAALVRLAGLPPLHRDPFDRILVAQALQYDLKLAKSRWCGAFSHPNKEKTMIAAWFARCVLHPTTTILLLFGRDNGVHHSQ